MPKFLLDILKSRFAILLGGALAAGIIIAALFSLWKSMGLRYLLLVLGGLMLGALFIFGIFAAWQYLERRRGEKIEDALSPEPGARRQKHKQAKIAISDLRARWAESMSTFKATGVSIYELPWILIIGEPQSGKTTTLRESGLEFPLGKDALSGVGGTVNLDWWFTNDAVIIDTAGRFTMPVDLAPDEKEWQAFLHILAKYRPRCPINGVIVTIPVTSLLEDSQLIIEEKANHIREKLRELGSVLNVEFPVYIMITKADLVYGFTEFCASLSAGERAQVLGWSRRDVSSAPFSGKEFSQFFDNLADRLHYWSLRRLKVMSPGDEADRVFSFPGEFRQLKRVLGNYLSLIFSKSSFHSPVFWRGCFFSSGLQEGRAIAKAVLEGVDRTESDVLSKLAASFIKSRAYFINIFYKKVFQERWLVKKAGGARRKEIISRAVAGISALIFFLGAGGLLWSGYKEISDIVNPLDLQVRAASA